MIRPGALKKFAIISPAPRDWLLKRGTLLIGTSPLFNWPHRLSGKTIKNGRRNMRDEAANKIFKIDAATLAMCACTKNPNRRRDASEGNKNVYGAWRVYMCIYIHIYVYVYIYIYMYFMIMPERTVLLTRNRKPPVRLRRASRPVGRAPGQVQGL